MKPPKKKKCAICKKEYTPKNSLQKVCSPKCAYQWVGKDNERKARKQAQVQRKRYREDKERIKTKPKLTQEAEKEARLYARLRDKDQPCISCGRWDWEIEDTFSGGKWDGGHFRGKGACPELRFHPLNIHKQCKSCNGGSGKFAKKNETVAKQYEENLRARIGDKMVDWLKGPHDQQNLIHDELREIKAYYKEQIKLLRSE